MGVNVTFFPFLFMDERMFDWNFMKNVMFYSLLIFKISI